VNGEAVAAIAVFGDHVNVCETKFIVMEAVDEVAEA
jgi:hypothetical protein